VLAVALGLLLSQGSDGGLSAESRSAHEIWALCTGHAALARVTGSDSPAAVVDAALTQCETEEAAMRKALRTQYNAASVDRTIKKLRQVAHEELARHVSEWRARRSAK
jgi:hypothetical protein